MITHKDFMSMIFQYYFTFIPEQNSVLENFLKENDLYSISNLNTLKKAIFVGFNILNYDIDNFNILRNKLYRNDKLKHIINNVNS